MKDPLQKYPHAVHVIQVGSRQVRMLIPEDPDGIFFAMTEDEFGEDERLPHWARLWPGAVALGEFLDGRAFPEGCRVLDLGCGLALNGILAAMDGADVLASDWFDEALAFASGSARLNGVSLKTGKLDWNFPPDDLRFDWVLGADLLYEARNHEPILHFLDVVLEPRGRAILTDHGRPHLPMFRKLLSESHWGHKESMQGKVHVFELWKPLRP